MSVPRITAVELSSAGRPLLVLGPSLGTSAQTLWTPLARVLNDRFHLVAWDLPGHGRNRAPACPFTMAELADGVVALVDDVAGPDAPFFYAGDSVGGAVGQHLLLDHPGRVPAAALMCTGAKIGTPEAWAERAARVRACGTPCLVAGSAQRWFSPGFTDREPGLVAALLHALHGTDREGYALVCEALAGFDVRDRLGEITAPVLAIAGSDDVPTPPASLEDIAARVVQGRVVTLDGVAHLAPAEAPERVAALLNEHFGGTAFA